MNNLFADRMATTQKSFIREILKVTQDSNVISFAGGLPNPKLFPVKELADIIKAHNMVLVEDNPYGELRFMGEDLPSMKSYLPDGTIVLGSFSKVVTPGLRLGWICAAADVMEKIVVAKQSSDLHSNCLSQRAVYRYLIDHNLDEHILNIREVYKRQRDLMVSMIEQHFPEEIKCTKPEGGMFLWATLPENLSSLHLFKLATAENIAFVPGRAFYVDGGGDNTLRLNFSNSDEEKIEEGIKRLAKVIKRVLMDNK
jgi:2-aminoadipate transaminase